MQSSLKNIAHLKLNAYDIIFTLIVENVHFASQSV